ncbi:MAG: hypothetical protein ACXVCY_11500 [Pseudobdellovibrionaceae bacterium]
MRIFFITIATLVVFGVLILMARIWGFGQNYTAYEHSFFSGPPPLIIVKADTLEKADEILKLRSDAVLWLDVRVSKDKISFVLPEIRDREFLEAKHQEQEKNPTKPIMIGNKLAEYPWDQIKEFYKNPALLKDFYEKFPQTRFVLNIIDNVAEVHQTVVDTVKDLNPDKRTFIQSEFLVIMTTVKELKPEWVYGTSIPDLVRLLTFDSMWILPSTQFKGDVFIAPFKLQNRPAFNDDIISEMRRRKKRIFLGPIHTETELAEARRLQADGYITDDLQKLNQMLGQSPK